MTTPPGWFPDPLRRFELRYWNGDLWTEHVATAGQQTTDPAGTRPSSTREWHVQTPTTSHTNRPLPPPTASTQAAATPTTGIPEHLNVIQMMPLAETSDHHSFFWPHCYWSPGHLAIRTAPTEHLKATYPLTAAVTFLTQSGTTQVGQGVRHNPRESLESSGELYVTDHQLAGGIATKSNAAGFALPHDLLAVILFRRPAKNELAIKLAMKQHQGEGLLGVELSLQVDDRDQQQAIKTIRDWSIVGMAKTRPWFLDNTMRQVCQRMLDQPVPTPTGEWEVVAKNRPAPLDFTVGAPAADAFRHPAPELLAEYRKLRATPPAPSPVTAPSVALSGFWPDPYAERRLRLHHEGRWTRHLLDQFRSQPDLADLPQLLAKEQAGRSWDGYALDTENWVGELYPSAPLTAPTELIERFHDRGLRTTPFPVEPDHCHARVSYATSQALTPHASKAASYEFKQAGWLLLTATGIVVYAQRPPDPPEDDERTGGGLYRFLQRVESFDDWTHADSALVKVGERVLRRRSTPDDPGAIRAANNAHDMFWSVEQTTIWDVPWATLARWRLRERAIPHHFTLEFDIRCAAPRGTYLTHGFVLGEVPVELALDAIAARLDQQAPGTLAHRTPGQRVWEGTQAQPAGAYRPSLLWAQEPGMMQR